MKSLTAIRHVAFEDLGTFARTAESEGYRIDYRQAGVDPIDAGSDLLVVMGGPIGAYEEHLYPFLIPELKAIESRLRAGLPTLGVCLGAQLMARALGAKVYAGGAGKEIGWSSLALTEAGQVSPIGELGNTPVLHWHGDTFDLPDGAVLLASTQRYPHQAYAWGKCALAMQFHPEIDAKRLEEWLIGHACELSHAQIDLAALRRGAVANGGELARRSGALLRNWLRNIHILKG